MVRFSSSLLMLLASLETTSAFLPVAFVPHSRYNNGVQSSELNMAKKKKKKKAADTRPSMAAILENPSIAIEGNPALQEQHEAAAEPRAVGMVAPTETETKTGGEAKALEDSIAGAIAAAEAEAKALAELDAKAATATPVENAPTGELKEEPRQVSGSQSVEDVVSQAEAETKAALAEAQAAAGAEAKAKEKAIADAIALAEAEAKALAEADAKALAEAKAAVEAEAKVKQEAKAQAAAEAEAKAKMEAEARAKDPEVLAAKYGAIEDVGERAFAILMDLGMASSSS